MVPLCGILPSVMRKKTTKRTPRKKPKPQTDAEWLKDARSAMRPVGQAHLGWQPGLSQSQLARHVGVSASLVRAIEQGSRSLQPRMRAQVEALPLKLAAELDAKVAEESTRPYLANAGQRAMVAHVSNEVGEAAIAEARRQDNNCVGYISPAQILGEWAAVGAAQAKKARLKK